MSANVEQMLYNQQNGLPWHKEGVAIEGLANAHQVMEHAGLDWKVDKVDMRTVSGIEIPNHFAMVRDTDQSVLGVVGNRYRPMQNEEAFEFFDPIIERGEAIYETAGSLNGGRQVWLLAKLPNHIRIAETDDIIENFVLLTNSHDGTKPVVAKVTPIRVVCSNTLNFALSKKGGSETTIRHTTNMMSRVQEAHKVLSFVNKNVADLDVAFNSLAQSKINDRDAEQYFERVLNGNKKEISTRTKNVIEELMDTYETGIGTDMPHVRGTVWGAYNAVTEYVDHVKSYRKDTDKTHAIIFGSGSATKEQAFKVAMAMTN